VDGLTEAANSLRGSLQNPSLNDEARATIQGELSRAESMIDRMTRALAGEDMRDPGAAGDAVKSPTPEPTAPEAPPISDSDIVTPDEIVGPEDMP